MTTHYLTPEACESRLTALRDRIVSEAEFVDGCFQWPRGSDFHRLPLEERIEVRRMAIALRPPTVDATLWTRDGVAR